MQRCYYDVQDDKGEPILLHVTAQTVAGLTGLCSSDVHRHVGKLLYGKYLIKKSEEMEFNTQEAADAAFVRKFGVKAFREWVTMNVRYGGKRNG